MTVEHLIAHRSGIGDYPTRSVEAEVDRLRRAGARPPAGYDGGYLAVLDGFATAVPARRALRVLQRRLRPPRAARRAGRAASRSTSSCPAGCEPAGMGDTSFPAPTSRPADPPSATSRPTGPRTNVLHLPVLGMVDGGIYDGRRHSRLWRAFLAGGSSPRVGEGDGATPQRRRKAQALRARVLAPPVDRRRHSSRGWTSASRSTRPTTRAGSTFTVVSNTSDGAWPVARYLVRETLGNSQPEIGDPVGLLDQESSCPGSRRNAGSLRTTRSSPRSHVSPTSGTSRITAAAGSSWPSSGARQCLQRDALLLRVVLRQLRSRADRVQRARRASVAPERDIRRVEQSGRDLPLAR